MNILIENYGTIPIMFLIMPLTAVFLSCFIIFLATYSKKGFGDISGFSRRGLVSILIGGVIFGVINGAALAISVGEAFGIITGAGFETIPGVVFKISFTLIAGLICALLFGLLFKLLPTLLSKNKTSSTHNSSRKN